VSPSTPAPRPHAWPPAGLVYGVDPSRFQDSNGDGIGDLPGITGRLDHIAALGADWLWLLPVYPSLRRDNGYDVDDHEGIDPRFGTLADFAALVDGCHARGIRLMIDLVIHNTAERRRWFRPEFGAADHEVFEEIVRVAALWLERGVDGFRIDAAIPAERLTPTEGTGADPASLYERLRRRLVAVRDDVVLVAQADVPPHELAALSDHGRVDAVVDFSLNNSIFLALARGDAGPLQTALEGLDRSVPAPARLNFVRNADELELDRLADDERAEVFSAFGGSRASVLRGRGLRRGWAPMIGDERRFRMSLSLLFALPGVPQLMYGQELGIGDDLSVEGPDACRPVMQWAAAPGGGFTKAADAPLILPAQRGGPFGFPHVNARSQATDDRSHLVLTRRLAKLRRRVGLASRPVRRHALPHSPSVLALSTNGYLTLHNLSGSPAEVFEAYGAEPVLTERWNGHRLGPHGFAWLRRE
jgi:maltose alpha-D-glucosyltransferase/alpha-amylase